MASTSSPGTSRRRPPRVKGARRFWLWTRKYIVPSVLFAVPAYFGSKFIQHLGGGALWFPKEWRETVSTFGLLIGLATFNYARLHPGREAARPPDETGKVRALFRLPSLRCYLLALAILGVYIGLRYKCVYSWSPRAEWLALHAIPENGAEGLPAFIEQEPRRLSASESSGSACEVWRGSFLVPLYFSGATLAALDGIEREQDRDPLLYCLECNEEWLIDRIEYGERFAMAITTIVFFLVHMGVLAVACFGFGSEFSVPEEVGSELARIV